MGLNSSRPSALLTIDSLDTADREELRALPHGQSFERSLFLWAKEVARLEREAEYTGTQDDFSRALWHRDHLEECSTNASPRLGVKLRAAVDPLDQRYRAATREHSQPAELETPYDGDPPYQGFPGWWWSRWPKRIDQRTVRERMYDRRKGGSH